MRRERTRRIVVGFIVVGFVVATFGLVVDPSADEAAVTTTTLLQRRLDPAACEADVQRIEQRLGTTFDAAASGDDTVDAVDDDDWTVFFEGIATHCDDVGSAVSDVIMFATERTDAAADDPIVALAPALTAAQLCNTGLPLTDEARLACASADDVLRLDDVVTGTTTG